MSIYKARHDNAVSQINVSGLDVGTSPIPLDYIDDGARRGVNDDGYIVLECLGGGVKVHAGVDCERGWRHGDSHGW